MEFIIDRLEGDFAVVELPDGKMANIPKVFLPPKAKEGDVLEIRISREKTDLHAEAIAELMESVWED